MKEEIIKTMESLVGKNFIAGGRSPEAGFDCVGTIVYTAIQNGIEVQDLQGYSQTPSNGLFLKAIDNNLVKVKKENLQAGDLVIFSDLQEFHHIGMITRIEPVLWIVHAVSGTTNKVVGHEFGKYWQSKKHRFYRFKGIEE